MKLDIRAEFVEAVDIASHVFETRIGASSAPESPGALDSLNYDSVDYGSVEVPDRQINYLDIMKVAQRILDWHVLAFVLPGADFTYEEIQRIEQDYSDEGREECAKQVLLKWQDRQGKTATLAKLVDILWQVDLVDLKEELCSRKHNEYPKPFVSAKSP